MKQSAQPTSFVKGKQRVRLDWSFSTFHCASFRKADVTGPEAVPQTCVLPARCLEWDSETSTGGTLPTLQSTSTCKKRHPSQAGMASSLEAL